MKTVLTSTPFEAADFIKKGGIVAFPTETVYGLGADIFDARAIARIFTAKKRPSDNPLIAHIGSLSQVSSLVKEVTPSAEILIKEFFPGPLTLVLPKAPKVPMIATANLETVGIRMPRNKLTNEFLRECGTPVAAPSANLSGKPSPTSWQAVFEDLNGRIDCILQGEIPEIGIESTVVDCTGDTPIVLRTGGVSVEQLKEVIPDTEIYSPRDDEKPRSPGIKHKHYSPEATVILVSSGEIPATGLDGCAFIGLVQPFGAFDLVEVARSPEDYARRLFDFFRKCDRLGIRTIYCEIIERTGIGTALMDRLRKASGSQN